MRTERQLNLIRQSAEGSKIRNPKPVIHTFFPVEQSDAEKAIAKVYTAEVMSDNETKQHLFDCMRQENPVLSRQIVFSFRDFSVTDPEFSTYYLIGALGGYHTLRESAKRQNGRLPKVKHSMIEGTRTEQIGGEDALREIEEAVNQLGIVEKNTPVVVYSAELDRRREAFYENEQGISQAIEKVLGVPEDNGDSEDDGEEQALTAFREGVLAVASVFQRYQEVHALEKFY